MSSFGLWLTDSTSCLMCLSISRPPAQIRPILLCLAVGNSQRHAWKTLKTLPPLYPQVYRSSISSRRPRGSMWGERPASSARSRECRPLSLPGKKTKQLSRRRPGEAMGFLLLVLIWSQSMKELIVLDFVYFPEVEATKNTYSVQCNPFETFLESKRKMESIFKVVLFDYLPSTNLGCVSKNCVWWHFFCWK